MEKICNCKPTYMQPIDKTLNFHEKSSFWHVNYGRFWLDDSSETPWRSLKPTMLKDLFTDPSWTWLPGPEAQTNLLPVVGGNCVCKSFVSGKLSVHMGICFVWVYVSSCSWMVNQSKSAYCILPSWFVGQCCIKRYPRQQKQFVTYPAVKVLAFTLCNICCWGSICWSFGLHLPCSNRSLGSGTSDALGIPTPCDGA